VPAGDTTDFTYLLSGNPISVKKLTMPLGSFTRSSGSRTALAKVEAYHLSLLSGVLL